MNHLLALVLRSVLYRYFHRSLNPKKLVATGFSAVPRHMTMASLIKANLVPDKTSLPGLREIKAADAKAVAKLLTSYMARFDIAPIFSEEDVLHNFVSGLGRGESTKFRREGQVTWSYVVEVSRISLREWTWAKALLVRTLKRII